SAAENQKYLQRSRSSTGSSSSNCPYGSAIDNSIAMAIAGSVVNGGGDGDGGESSPNSIGPSSPVNYRHQLTYQPVGEETTRLLLASLLWVLGNNDHRLLSRYLSEFSNERLLAFLELIRLASRVFEYAGEK